MILWVCVILFPAADVQRSDLLLFPDHETVARCRLFNQQHRDWLIWKSAGEYSSWRHEFYEEWQRETTAAYQPWDWLWHAQNNTGYTPEECLRSLRYLIGDDAYFRGIMPTCIPIQRFEVIR